MSAKTKERNTQSAGEDTDPTAEVPALKHSKKAKASHDKQRDRTVAARAHKQDDHDEEPEEDPEEDQEEDPELSKKQKQALTKKRKKAKLVGYRSLSKSVGYIDTTQDGGSIVMGKDCVASLLSEADAKRLMRFVPATPGSTGFCGDEFVRRLELFKSSVPSSAARETQARCDAALRSVMNQAVLRSVESGKKVISASTMASVLRPYVANMNYTAVVPPIGLVRFAQDTGILGPPDDADAKKRADEKKLNAANKKAYNDFIDTREKTTAAKRAKRALAQDAQAAVVSG